MSKSVLTQLEELLAKKVEENIHLMENKHDRDKQIAELESKVLALEKEKEDSVAARKQLIECWESKTGVVGLKSMGEIDVARLQTAVGSKFLCTEDEDPVGKIKEVCAFWQSKISDMDWDPFKLEPVSFLKKRQKKVIDPEDGYLKMLKVHLGDEACELVISALKEMNEYNPVKRSPVLELWNFARNRRATLKEAVQDANFPNQKKATLKEAVQDASSPNQKKRKGAMLEVE